MNRARAHTDRAEMLLDLRRPADAEREARAALSEDPEDARAHLQLSRALSRQGDVQGALDAVDRYVAMRPERWIGHWTAGVILYRADRDREALTAFLHAREHGPDEPDVYRMLAWTHYALGEAEPARAAAEHGLRLAPGDAGIAAVLALVLLRLRDEPGARAHAERALSLAPEDPSVHRWYGTVALATGRPRAAADAFRESLRADPGWSGGPAVVLLAERRRVPGSVLDRLLEPLREGPRRHVLLCLAGSAVAPCLLVNIVITLLTWLNLSIRAGTSLWLGRDPRVRPLMGAAERRAAAISAGLLFLGAALLAGGLHAPSVALPGAAVLALVTPVQETARLDGRRRTAFAVLTIVLAAALAILTPVAPWMPVAVLCAALGSAWLALLVTRRPW
ncbi:tetratricopeptide repeat protein [Actinomadura sp. WMMB 499]|uniref:tetratricopeptide repeat protein n=1 Tax=Actinomadura sp. WMMB 499 TaxID=1219491 RepID=UPI0012484F11|nr:tetratricopeptide repeat protein [Actinomadura sp. WMMB 499]QFG24925.1 tetratricopeptide repeat protein [Actinomadura sp. WMMB 499]